MLRHSKGISDRTDYRIRNEKLEVKDFVLKDNQTYVVCDCDCGNKDL